MGDIKAFADSLTEFRKGIEEDRRQDLLRRMNSLFYRWRSATYVGFDTSLGSESERTIDFEKALDLLAECYDELQD